jgi:phage baseplate assembly protein V
MTIDRRNPSVRADSLRASVSKVDDSGPQQLLELNGLKGQVIGEAVRVQHFGMTSNPPSDAEGVVLSMGGGHDRAMVVGVEDPKTRPTGLKTGETTVYDANKNHINLKSDRIALDPSSASRPVYLGGPGPEEGTYALIPGSINVWMRTG